MYRKPDTRVRNSITPIHNYSLDPNSTPRLLYSRLLNKINLYVFGSVKKGKKLIPLSILAGNVPKVGVPSKKRRVPSGEMNILITSFWVEGYIA